MVSKPTDRHCPFYGSAHVVENYDCMLNQVDIVANSNKFYVLQLVERDDGTLHVFTRYGRVGEVGTTRTIACSDMKAGVADFKKRFKSKTGNKWDQRDQFVKKKKKYAMIDVEEVGNSNGEAKGPTGSAATVAERTVQACTLDPKLQHFLALIFSKDMFKAQMETTFQLDTRKLPLGQLSKKQLDKGMRALIDIEQALQAQKPHDTIADLCSMFYTIIPHASNRGTPLPVFSDPATVQQKKDMLSALGDIEAAMAMQKAANVESVEHPTDLAYRAMGCKLTVLDKASKEFQILARYAENTKKTGKVSGYCCGTNVKRSITEIFRVDREGSAQRYSAHTGLKNRKLLWHGTNVAVVAAILQSGLRIMPHSGGRVGRGIYLASENNKSAAYVTQDYKTKTGIMFLCEAALGREKHIVSDDASLRCAPDGYDSVVALGQTEPEPARDTVLQLDGLDVTVPQGLPLPNQQLKGRASEFTQSEYLLYKESQVRIRYVLQMRWG